VACGGSSDEEVTNKCFELGGDLTDWIEVLPLPDGNKQCMRSSIIDGKWILSGGHDFGREYNSMLFYDGLFDFVPPMPEEKACHCHVNLNDTHIFFTGGTSKSSFMVNWQTQEWTVYDDTTITDVRPACGFVDTPFGREILVAAGDKAEIFSLRDLQWKEGPILPTPLYDSAQVQLSNGFLAVSGYDEDFIYLDTIYRFDSDAYSWLLEEARLSVPRGGAAAVAVPDAFLNCE